MWSQLSIGSPGRVVGGIHRMRSFLVPGACFQQFAGVVDQDVDAAETAHGGLRGGLRVGGRWQGTRRAAVRRMVWSGQVRRPDPQLADGCVARAEGRVGDAVEGFLGDAASLLRALQAKAGGDGGQRSMAAMFASSWRSPEAGVRLFKRSS